MVGVTSAVTLAGIRDADPGVVAALVERRGPSVFAYCELVAAPGSASIAAADALARFRLSVIAVEHLNKSDAESRLRSATREAATRRGTRAVAGREGDAAAGACAKTESDLLHHLLDTRSSPDRDALSAHIADCQGCQETLERLEAAELAFARPATTALPSGVAEQIVTAIVIAAPVRIEGENVASVRRKALRLLAGRPADATESPVLAPAEPGGPLSPEAIAALSAYAATPADGSDLSLGRRVRRRRRRGGGRPAGRQGRQRLRRLVGCRGAEPASPPRAGARRRRQRRRRRERRPSQRERFEARAAAASAPAPAGAGAASRWPASSPCSSSERAPRWR